MRAILIFALVTSVFAPPAFAATAFLKSSYVSGMNRICIYNHLGSQHIITIKATELCPLTLQL